MKFLGTFLLFCCLISSAQAESLTPSQRNKELGWQVLNLIDYGQTLDIADQCSAGYYYETNPILGRCPSKEKVTKYFIAAAVLHYAFTMNMGKYRDSWQNVTLVITAGYVAHNHSIGLHINF